MAEEGGQAQTQEEFQRRGSMPTGPKDRLRSASHFDIPYAQLHVAGRNTNTVPML